MGEERHDGLRNAFHHIIGVYLTDSEGKGLHFGAFVTLFQRLHFPLLHMLTSPLPSSASSPIEVALSLLHRPKDDLLCLASLSQASRELVWNVSVIFLARCLFLSQTILPTPLLPSSSSLSPARRKGINISLNLFLELLLASDRVKLWKSFASQECLLILKLFHTEKAFIFTQRSSSSSSSRDVERIARENKEALGVNVTTELSPFAPKDPKVPFNEAEMPFEETVVDIKSDVFTDIALSSPSFAPLLRPKNRDLVFPSSLRHQPTYPIHEPTVQNTSSSPPSSSSFSSSAAEVCHFSAPNAVLEHNKSLSATGLSFNTNLFLPSSAPLLALLHEQTANTTTITNSPSSSSSSLAVPVSDAPIWSLLEDLERQTEAILRPSSRSRKRKEPFRRQLDEGEEERGELEGARDGIPLAASESVEVSYFNILNENEDEVSALKSTSKGKRNENRAEKKTMPRVRRKSAALSRLELLEQLEAQILGSD